MSRLRVVLLLSLVTLCAPAFGANPARPGTLNYVEGSATADGQKLTEQSIGSTELRPGQTLATTQGKAEMLLTPGVFLRLGDNSSVQMISPDLTYTAVDLTRGRAMVEVDQIYPQNNLQVIEAGVPTQLLKNGLYEFNADASTVSVLDGKAAVHEANKWVVVKKSHQITLAPGETSKPQKLEASASARPSEDPLYVWSSLRSQYLAEANEQIAGQYSGVSAFAPGWYWDPYFWDYTFIGPGPIWSPFGWGFYPPWYFGGFYGYGFGPGYALGRGFYGHGFGGRGFGGFGGGFHGGGGRR